MTSIQHSVLRKTSASARVGRRLPRRCRPQPRRPRRRSETTRSCCGSTSRGRARCRPPPGSSVASRTARTRTRRTCSWSTSAPSRTRAGSSSRWGGVRRSNRTTMYCVGSTFPVLPGKSCGPSVRLRGSQLLRADTDVGRSLTRAADRVGPGQRLRDGLAQRNHVPGRLLRKATSLGSERHPHVPRPAPLFGLLGLERRLLRLGLDLPRSRMAAAKNVTATFAPDIPIGQSYAPKLTVVLAGTGSGTSCPDRASTAPRSAIARTRSRST